MKEQAEFVLHLRDERPHRDDPAATLKLRRALKTLLRGFGFRCTSVLPAESPAAVATDTPNTSSTEPMAGKCDRCGDSIQIGKSFHYVGKSRRSKYMTLCADCVPEPGKRRKRVPRVHHVILGADNRVLGEGASLAGAISDAVKRGNSVEGSTDAE